MTYRIGIDVGGTFTDLFLGVDGRGARSFKVLSTPHDPSEGVLDGLRLMAQDQGLSPQEFAKATSVIVHGTTVTTNAVLTRGGARTGLLTTAGVRDALQMRRGVREEQYDNRFTNVVPLVPRRRRLAVPGRLDFAGRETAPQDLEAIDVAARTLGDAGCEAVAICFMHSYANPAHERAAAEAVRAALPEAYVSVSSDVLPTIRFYERVSTTALDAYVGPVLRSYLGALTTRLADSGFEGVLLIMQSNGGVALPEVTERRPAGTLLSGPAAGPRAAATVAQAQGSDDCVLMDMGGTSFDVSLVSAGAASLSADGAIDRLRIALPMLDIVTIGAGGGSVGWIDDGGLLRMGPASAGASPGPACYGRGGELPTCTDADLLLGYLDPQFFAGGRLPLDRAKAEAAVTEHISDPLGMSVEDAAAGMYRVINANMAHGVREITVKVGLDPREFPLVVAGGAGALHACMIAEELEMPTLIVPAAASTLCATGMLLSDLQHDFVRSCVGPLHGLDVAHVQALVAEMSDQGQRELALEGATTVEHEISLDLRYLKQYHEVTVLAPEGAVASGDLAAVAEAFHADHDRLYGYNLAAQGTDLELINVRVRSMGRTDKPELPEVAAGPADPEAALKGRRRAFVPETGAFEEVPVYDGHALPAGAALAGPALVERTDTTVFVSRGFTGAVDRLGSIVLRARTQEGPDA